MKVCSKCREPQELSEFSPRKDSADGLAYWCKSCMSANYRRTREKRLEYQKTYYSAHREQALAYQIQYYAGNRFKVLSYQSDRRALLKGAFVEEVDRRVVWGRDEGHCRVKLVCDGVFVPFEDMHLDHIIPITKDGEHSYANVQTACAPCNLSKGNKVLEVRT